MRIIALVLGMSLLSTTTAAAFNCSGVKFPWDIVVCSDVELQNLADQRLEAFMQAKARLTAEQIEQLRREQAAWVHSYSASCGILGDRAPPSLIPAEIIECFRRAGTARLVYLRAYRVPREQTSQPENSLPANRSSGAGSDIPPGSPGAGPSAAMVAMEPEGGIYLIPVRINRALTLRFIIDSGATDVSIPADVVLTLARTGTISDNDFIGDRHYQLGDGSTVKSARLVLRELQVGDQVVRNVTASVGRVESVPLLGQSFLSRFTSWTLDNNQHLLLLGR